MPSRATALLLPLLLAACGARSLAVPRATAHPVRVFSANQCTDQIILALLPPERIASVTWLSRDGAAGPVARAAQGVDVNHGLVEEVIAQRPDLVIAGSVSTPALRAMLTRIGYPLLEVDEADSIAAIRANMRRIAAAVDARARGEALIADMDRTFATLARDPAPPIPVVAWDRSGFAAGRGSLFDAILTAAGARNELANGGDRRPDVETLLRADPALLVQGSGDPGATSLGDEAMRHPLVRRFWGQRAVAVPHADYLCGTPRIADAALRLRARLRVAAGRVGTSRPVADTLR